MAQLPDLTPTEDIATGEYTIIRQGGIDKRIPLELSATLAWAKRNGYNRVGDYFNGVQFSSESDFVTFEGGVYFVKEGVGLPYVSSFTDPSLDGNLYIWEGSSLEYTNSNSILHDTLVGAINRDDLIVGKSVVSIEERSGALFDAVTGEMADGFSIIQSVSDPAIQLKLKLSEYSEIDTRYMGAVGNGLHDDTQATQYTMNYCWSNRVGFYKGAGDWNITSTLYPMFLQDGVNNFQMPYTLRFSGPSDCIIQYNGTGTAISLDQTAFQKSARYGEVIGGFRLLNLGGLATVGLHCFGLNHWNFARIVVEGFIEHQVLFESQNGRGGLWNRFEDLEVRGDNVGNNGLTIGLTANSNFFDRVWAGYCLVDQINNGGERNTFNSVSIENGVITSPICRSGFYTTKPCAIYSIEIEMQGTTGNPNFLGGIYVDAQGVTSTFVSIFQYTAVGVTPRYDWTPEAKVIIYPTTTTSSLSTRLEIVTSDVILVRNLRSLPKVSKTDNTHANIGVNNSYGTYETLWSGSFTDTLDVKRITVTNNTDVSVQFQMRMVDTGNNEGTAMGLKTIVAGETYVLTVEDIGLLYNGLDNGSSILSIKARYRTTLSSFIGDVSTLASGLIL